MTFVCYFVPLIIATACFLPLAKTGTGQKVAVGFFVIMINALMLCLGIFRRILAKNPFINWFAIIVTVFGGFFTTTAFEACAKTLQIIELIALIGMIASWIFWHFYNKYKAMAISVKGVVKSGLLDSLLYGETK
jgi:hypothetical protein